MFAPLVVTVAVMLATAAARPRPQAVLVAGEVEPPGDRRWDADRQDNRLARIAESFRRNEGLNRALLEVLKTLREEELGLLERSLGVDKDKEGGDDERDWQGDQPLEDTVDDSPQELEGGYRGDLAPLDAASNATGNATRAAAAPAPAQPPSVVLSPKINREKLKELRLATIKNQIMNILWPVGTPPTLGANSSTPSQDLLRAIADKMKTQRASYTPADIYTEKIQSFYPSCDIPRNTDAELWHESDPVNLLFDLAYPSPVRGSKVNIVAAKLRLYKLSQGNASPVEKCPPVESEDASISAPNPPPPSDDKMIRVSVYWYTRSLKKHRVKRKLLDSQMLPVAGETWTEWNVRGAVKAWRDSGRNFGLAVEVEDEDGTVLPAARYFAPMNCSQEASTSRPIPGFLVARGASNGTGAMGQALRLDSFLFPMIDLCTVEFPESERQENVLYHSDVGAAARSNATSDYSDPPQSVNVDDGERHRIRHQGHKRQPHRHLETVRRDDGDSIEEITYADDIEGHQLRKQIIVQKVTKKSQDDPEENDR